MHRHKKLSFAGVFMVAMAAAPAALADTNWSGLYVGASLGSRTVDSDWTTTSYSAPDYTLLPFSTDASASLESTAGYGGAFVGMNWEVAPSIIVSVEGALGIGDNKSTHISIPGAMLDSPPIYSYVVVEPSLQLDLVGRVGYLVTPRINVYGSAGLSALNVDVSATCPADTDFCNPSAGTQHNSASDTLTGWTVGVGAEMSVMANILVRLDYKYADYGTFGFNGLPAQPGISFGFTSDVSPTSSTVTLGAAYKF